MASVRRTRYLLLRCEQEPSADLGLLLRGEAKLAPARPDVAVSALTGEELPLAEGELDLLLAVPTDRWVPAAGAGDPASLARLVTAGLLVSDEPDPLSVELRQRDERLGAPPWSFYAAFHRAMTGWRDVEVAVSDEEASEQERAGELARGSPAFVERYGPPPPHFHEVADRQPLPPAGRQGALYDALLARRTTRGFDPDGIVTAEQLSVVLRYVWGCHGTARVGDDLVVLRKTSPSGGSLHPVEVYPLVRAVEGIEPGLYHYNVEHHALELLERLEQDEAGSVARSFLGGQWYFASAQVLFVMAARFHRSFWKYRDHEKAYSAILLDAGHLSQTLYLVCGELGLGAFVAGAINDVTIDERLGLAAFEEGSLAICGCGIPGPSGLEPRFEAFSP